MTTLIFSHREWKNLKRRILDEYGTGIFLISWRLKRELGFRIRTHTFYDEYNQRKSYIILDFDDPAHATFFNLKYAHSNG
jgi:hypothetical protein